MWDSAELIDDEQLIYKLLQTTAPEGSTVIADLDVDSIEDLPCITFVVTGEGQTGNGPGLWDATLLVNVFADDDTAFTVCKALYRGIHLWEHPDHGFIEGIGAVEEVGDVSKFSRLVSGVQMIGKSVTQYSGTFGLALRN